MLTIRHSGIVRGLFALACFLLAASVSPARPQVGGKICSCQPEVQLLPDDTCPCPGLTLTNLTTSRLGRCSSMGSNCTGVSTQNCKVVGTVSESGCSGGFVDEPFSIQASCLSFDHMVDFPISCTGSSGTHRVGLNCKACS